MTTLTNPYIAYRLQGQTDSEWTLVEVTDGVFPETVPVTEGGTYEVCTMTWSEIASAYVYSPIMLFQAGEQGVWYDPSDLTTLYQDAAGTTPVTGVEQPVGLMLDKSKGLTLGTEVVTNGGFATDTWWSKDTGVTIGSNVCSFSSVANSAGVYKAALLSANTYYEVTYTVNSVTVGAFKCAVGGTQGTARTAAGTYTERIYNVTAGTSFGVVASGTTTGVIDNVSVKPVSGNHAYATATGNRVTLRAKYNQLLNTEILATQNVATVAAQYKLYFTGTGSVTLSGTATGTYTAGSNTITCTAGTLTVTVTGSVLTADLRVANDGVGLPAYQRVASATDYDTTGFPPYLTQTANTQFLRTGNIDFSGTDKMTLFAGVRKTSDAVNWAIVCELSSNGDTSNGSFQLNAPGNASVSVDYAVYSRGTILASTADPGTYLAPITNVLTGQTSISGDSLILRVNGTQAVSSSSDQGTGNYGTYPLYLFMRGGTTLPLTGRLYQLIVRGAESSAAQITASETYVNQKTKAY